MRSDFLVPDWPAPKRVGALQTTRRGGMSLPPYDSFNLGSHVGDDPIAVERNRIALNAVVPTEPIWLEQVHGTKVVAAETASCLPQADASVAVRNNAVCVVMTADCLPVLLCDQAGSVVAAAHAGWRGLLDGVLEATVTAMHKPGEELLAWFGPAIGPRAFEVGAEVRAAFVERDVGAAPAFVAAPGGKYLADLALLARRRLAGMGVTQVYGGEWCTYEDAERFYSYRRDGRTGRMASLIWLHD